jgi:DNA replication initiation complex subunit (GINS family)
MGEDLNYKRLRDLAREEKTTPALVKVGPEFYSSVEKFLSENFNKMEETTSVMQMREFENATAIIREIALIRQQKILFRAVRGRGSGAPSEEMTREEYGIYDRFCNIITEENGRLDSLLARFERRNGAPAAQIARQERAAVHIAVVATPAQTAQQSASERKVKKVRFIKDVNAYIGANKETFGPYKNGEEGALPCEEADLLLRQKMAEFVE